MFGKDTKKEELINNLSGIFTSLQERHHISASDFPDVVHMQKQLQYHDFSRFPPITLKKMEIADSVLDDIAQLMTSSEELAQHADTAVIKVLLLAFISRLLCTSIHYEGAGMQDWKMTEQIAGVENDGPNR